MTFIANCDIGEFKKGDEVPKDRAALWNTMFLVKPCDEVADAPMAQAPVQEVKKPDVKPGKPRK